ncbi:hypothetical protein ACFE6N_16220 [Pedobacter sp. BG31]|uniref:hypothetical protein n=1 Tax=Pedobacter sp. BG31 TaxID=3349697 RepID=UPI0035F4276D
MHKTKPGLNGPSSFYASCQPLLAPEYHVPLIVLSSNDACIIALGNEAKAGGIVMGPLFL